MKSPDGLLAETGYVVGRNVRYEYRWTEDASPNFLLAESITH